MADENTEEKKKGGILKLLMFVGGGILLVGIGLGVVHIRNLNLR